MVVHEYDVVVNTAGKGRPTEKTAHKLLFTTCICFIFNSGNIFIIIYYNHTWCNFFTNVVALFFYMFYLSGFMRLQFVFNM